ncbi:single-stranded DNA-binding protein [Blastococcus xanthinilyticus]|uniref:Single-strand DNA-binding protein n=1 Tax=Blastococcus xanthinilyticus TaxID=1564164 RepID=A0A5S5CZ42_9ACTN|nr:single-stranded DNA-binding protein [Blastococcus xanthinilyticus]TYP87639.1 single-strand DNA-binding protein [Blastococcus xanthinilyticus]
MNHTTITVVGNVADDPRRKNTQNGTVTNFRMASTGRRYDSGSGQFVDSGTFWVDVECWNGLSGNVAGSISKGDPVIVHGTMTTKTWESDSGPRSKPQIKALAVGPNLAKGMAVFKRDRPGRAPEAGVEGTAPVEPDSQPLAEPGNGHPAADDLVAGRDYVGEEETLTPVEDLDLSEEPAHA